MRLSTLADTVALCIESGNRPNSIPLLKDFIGQLRPDLHAFDKLRAFADGDETARADALAICKAIVDVAEKSSNNGASLLYHPVY